MTIELPKISPPSHDPIQLREIAIYLLRPTLTFPFTTSFGTQQERDTVLVVLKSDSGIVGVGEAPTLTQPIFDDQYAWGEYDVLNRFIIPDIQEQLGGKIDSYDHLSTILSRFNGHSFGKCGLEAAYWHTVTQQTGNSLKTLWGGSKTEVFAGFSIGGKTVYDVMTRAQKAVDLGFKRLKVKIWPTFDTLVMDSLRERYPDIMLQVDANCAYNPFNPDHQEALKTLDNFDLLLIEQPFDDGDFFDHARFQADYELQTPICLDESVKSLDHVRKAYEIWDHFDIPDKLIINIKPARVSGYWQSRLIAEFGQQHNIPCWIGGMLEFGIGKWMNIILSSHAGCPLPGDHLQPQPYYQLDITNPLPFIQPDGTIPVPDQGVGCQIDWDAVEKLTIESKTITF